MGSLLVRFHLNYLDKWTGPPPAARPDLTGERPTSSPPTLGPAKPTRPPAVPHTSGPLSFQLLLGSGVGTVRLYDTEAKKNLCEININDDMPR